MPDVVVLQRIVPHYRIELFEQLYARYGWVTVASPDGETPHGPAFRFYPMPEAQRFGKTWVAVPLDRIVAELKPKIVLAEFSLKMTSTWHLIALAWRERLRVVFWSHGYNMQRGFWTPFDCIHQVLRGILARFGDGHVCYSEEGRQFLARFMSRERIFVARNTMRVSNLKRPATPRPPGGPRLLTVSRLTRGKEIDRLLRIFEAFRCHFPQSRLTIVGDGPELARLHRLAASLGADVTFTGAITDDARLAPLFGNADIFVLAGSAGLSVNHALLFGVPVVLFERAADGPFHGPEHAYVRDHVTGIRVKRHTDEAFATALVQIFNEHPDPKLAFHEAIAQFARENLDLENMIEDFGEVHHFLGRLGAQRT